MVPVWYPHIVEKKGAEEGSSRYQERGWGGRGREVVGSTH